MGASVSVVAAHYDLDPVEALVSRLSAPHPVPLWFVHAENDKMCPYGPLLDLVRQLREKSSAEIRLMNFVDKWSTTGHCADKAAFFAPVGSATEEVTMGNELFAWVTARKGPGILPTTFST